jgi:hypothetical protein
LGDQLTIPSKKESELQLELKSKATEIHELGTKLADRSAETQQLNTELISRNKEVQRLKEELTVKGKEVEQLQAILRDLLNGAEDSAAARDEDPRMTDTRSDDQEDVHMDSYRADSEDSRDTSYNVAEEFANLSDIDYDTDDNSYSTENSRDALDDGTDDNGNNIGKSRDVLDCGTDNNDHDIGKSREASDCGTDNNDHAIENPQDALVDKGLAQRTPTLIEQSGQDNKRRIDSPEPENSQDALDEGRAQHTPALIKQSGQRKRKAADPWVSIYSDHDMKTSQDALEASAQRVRYYAYKKPRIDSPEPVELPKAKLLLRAKKLQHQSNRKPCRKSFQTKLAADKALMLPQARFDFECGHKNQPERISALEHDTMMLDAGCDNSPDEMSYDEDCDNNPDEMSFDEDSPDEMSYDEIQRSENSRPTL